MSLIWKVSLLFISEKGHLLMFSDTECFKTQNYYGYMTFLIVDVYNLNMSWGVLGLG